MQGIPIVGNQIKYELSKMLDGHNVKCLLMRVGFVFDKDAHRFRKNIKATTGAISISFVAATKKIIRSSGSFITDGFVSGNKITTNATLNPGPFTIASVSALEIVVNETVVNEGPVTKTVTADDELATGNGYTQDNKIINLTAVLDLANDRVDSVFPNIQYTANGGSIGPTPCVLLYDDTLAGDPVIGPIVFESEVTKSDGETLTIANGNIRVA